MVLSLRGGGKSKNKWKIFKIIGKNEKKTRLRCTFYVKLVFEKNKIMFFVVIRILITVGTLNYMHDMTYYWHVPSWKKMNNKIITMYLIICYAIYFR